MSKHPLAGRKQTIEHVSKRVLSYPKNRKRRDPKKILLSKIKIADSGCWEWIGSSLKKVTGNYGQIRVGKRGESKLVRAHRYSYEIFVGKIPEGLSLDHLCKNTLCVNPSHLEPVTHAENMRRGRNATKTHCKNGHERVSANLYINPRGAKECAICRKIRRGDKTT
jgi:hypothetical protein